MWVSMGVDDVFDFGYDIGGEYELFLIEKVWVGCEE